MNAGSCKSEASEQAAPQKVFYVVETVGEVIGERQHRVRSPLYESRQDAAAEFERLRKTAGTADKNYSIWSSVAHTEPADWNQDVVNANGSVSRHTQQQP